MACRTEVMRVSMNDQFVSWTRCDEGFSGWALWDWSGPSGEVLEDGDGPPPARVLPTGRWNPDEPAEGTES